MSARAARDAIQPIRVLIAEDETLLSNALMQLLPQVRGAAIAVVATCATRSQTMRQTRTLAPDVILLDLRMPDPNGLQLARLIKQESAIRDTQLVLLTALAKREDSARLESADFAGYVTKPLRQHLLRACLRRLSGRAEVVRSFAPLVAAEAWLKTPPLAHPQARILLVDDNVTNQIVARGILEKLGYPTPDVAGNGLEALEALARTRYDLVLMDGQMPELDGFETARLIRCGTAGVLDPQVPIIAMTALVMPGDVRRCLEAGMDAYISKPVQPQELSQIIAEQLRRIRAARDAPPPDAAEVAVLEAVPAETATLSFDAEDMLGRVMGDRSIACEVIAQFQLDAAERLRELRAALNAADRIEVRRKAHSLVGLAANVSAPRLHGLAAALEELAECDDAAAEAERLTQCMEREFTGLQTLLLDWTRYP